MRVALGSAIAVSLQGDGDTFLDLLAGEVGEEALLGVWNHAIQARIILAWRRPVGGLLGRVEPVVGAQHCLGARRVQLVWIDDMQLARVHWMVLLQPSGLRWSVMGVLRGVRGRGGARVGPGLARVRSECMLQLVSLLGADVLGEYHGPALLVAGWHLLATCSRVSHEICRVARTLSG